MPFGPKPRRPVDRVLSKTLNTEDGCQVFTGSKRPDGYGQISVGSRADGTFRLERVHRVVYEALVGPIPDGHHLHHRCGRRDCVRLMHLEVLRADAHAQEHAADGTFANNGEHNRIKRHCPAGHPYEQEATPGLKRGCQICATDRMREKRETETGRPTQIPAFARTHCPQGHEYDEQNTRMYRGMRYCRACEFAKSQRSKKTDAPYRGAQEDRAACPAGHPYDEANTGVDKKGHRFCRACSRTSKRDYMRRKAAERKSTA